MDFVNMKKVLSAYSGKRVLVTGHTGFKGAWLTFLLAELGADVTGYALPPESGPSHFNMLKLDRRIHHVEGDIRDRGKMRAVLDDAQPEFVFHLAAQALVKRSYADAVDTFETNVLGSVNLLDAVRQCQAVRSLVCVTSDKCYENVEWVWGYRENDRLGGHDPYSASKAAAEIAFSAYQRSFFASRPGLGAATTRAGNVIGGGDWAADRIVPDCIRAIATGDAITLRHPHATRPWQHVLEPISGYMLLGARLRENPADYGGSWNFGPSTSEVRTVADVANSMLRYLGKGKLQIAEQQAEHHEATLLQLNCDKAHRLLNWHPRWNVDKTFAATAEWYKVALEDGDIEGITRAQLTEYFPEIAS
jgi:CDP-glucose 4,6-dehydratase